MSNSQLPERASIEYLKKLAKDRLRELRQADPHAKLATALRAVAQDHGFSSWRALKAEVDRRHKKNTDAYFEACAKGNVDALRDMLAADPSLVRLSDPSAQHRGWTGLHAAARNGHVGVVRLLLDHGANPNAREAGDNTYPLHWAAANRQLDTGETCEHHSAVTCLMPLWPCTSVRSFACFAVTHTPTADRTSTRWV